MHRNFYAEEGYITIFCWNFFFLTVPINFAEGINQCFRNIRARKFFLQKKGISYIIIFCWNLFSHSAEKFRGENHSMFQKNSCMENFMQKKELSLFSVGIFFLTVPKNFVR